MIAEDRAMLSLLEHLDRQDYHFVSPSPATQARVLARRRGQVGGSTEDILGWSMSFRPGGIDPVIEQALHGSRMVEDSGGLLRSRIRVSRLHDHLFLHSAYPTDRTDAVFFGPDTYRFVDFVLAELLHFPRPPERVVDLGTGGGAGAILIAKHRPDARIEATDPNPVALRLARVNAAHARADVDLIECAGLDRVEGLVDLIVANPPFIADAHKRKYRDGGDLHGGRLSLELANEALAKLAAGGRLMLYTGSAIVDGKDEIRVALECLAERHRCDLRYREIDPDVFGEELDEVAYTDVDRIAAVGAVMTARRTA